ncbi:MAG: ribosomal protein S18-alanine N-acetyltransferase [Defluviitaleaceae bacterium]|nr:ribosomal protein S18-alanine N-acetyltransferase [Defluviitaleaceae bacterium]
MLEIIPMSHAHLDAVCSIENECFTIPWSRQSFVDDLAKDNSSYFVAVINGEVAGYAGMWHIVNEGHITNVAVRPIYQNMGIGNALLCKIIDTAKTLEMVGILLEVRTGNYAAQKLYAKNGFILERIRKNYYAETGEDALIMWKELNNG